MGKQIFYSGYTCMKRSSDIVDINKYRGRRRISDWFRRTLVLVFLVACLFSGYFFSRSSFFTVTNIEITGNTHADYESLCRLSGYAIGESIFSVSRGDAEDYLRISPWVRSARVSLKLPGTVCIEVEERTPVAFVTIGNAVVELDNTGRVLERHSSLQTASLPFISGIDVHNCGSLPGSVIDVEGLEQALSILSSLPAEATDVGEINVQNVQDIRLYLLDGTEIRIGDASDFASKYVVYSNILKDIRSNSQQSVHYIDVSIPEWPVFK